MDAYRLRLLGRAGMGLGDVNDRVAQFSAAVDTLQHETLRPDLGTVERDRKEPVLNWREATAHLRAMQEMAEAALPRSTRRPSACPRLRSPSSWSGSATRFRQLYAGARSSTRTTTKRRTITRSTAA